MSENIVFTLRNKNGEIENTPADHIKSFDDLKPLEPTEESNIMGLTISIEFEKQCKAKVDKEIELFFLRLIEACELKGAD